MRRGLIPIAGVLALTMACSKDGPTTASGQIALAAGPAADGFELPEGTILRPEGGGRVAGRCVLGSSSTDVEIERTGSTELAANGLVWFRLRIDSPDTPPVAHVLAEHGGELYEADCDVANFARDRDEGLLEVTIAGCPLLSPTPSNGVASVELSLDLGFDSCEPL